MKAHVARGSWRRLLFGAASLVVTAGVFGYLLAHVSLRDVLDTIRAADVRYLAAFVALSFSMNVFRTWRYGLALAVAGTRPRAVALFLVVVVRNLFSDLLPARVGSLIYVYLLTKRLGAPFAAAASSFTLAFFFDTMAIAPLIVLAVIWIGGGAEVPASVLVGAAAALLAATAFALHLLPLVVRWAAWWLDRVPLLGRDRRARWGAAVAGVGRDVVQARESGVYFRLFALSLGVRLTKYAALYALMVALLRPLGYHASEVPVAKVFLGVCSSEVAASLPVSGIAGFGAYEGAWSAVFALLGFPADVAKLTSISHHLVTQAYGYGLGALALFILLLPWFRPKGVAPQSRWNGGRAHVFYGKLAAASLCMAAFVACCFNVVHLAVRRPASGPVPAAAELCATHGIDGMEGRILFDSDRGGTFGIHTMKPDGTDVRCLADGPMAEIYPDASPDGRRIVFARATSAAKKADSDVWICGRDGSGAHKLAENGTFPTFSADGKTVYFERDRRQVMAVGADGAGERELFPAGHADFSRRALVKPRVSPDGRWVAAISDKGGGWNVWAVELASGRAVHVGAGCEPAWFPDSRRVAWIRERGARQGTGVFVKDLQTGQTAELQDAGPPLGHEYFPTVTRDGRFLMWGACPPGQHEHDRSEYQLFVKDLAAGRVCRLTLDGHNNRWPKLLPPM